MTSLPFYLTHRGKVAKKKKKLYRCGKCITKIGNGVTALEKKMLKVRPTNERKKEEENLNAKTRFAFILFKL